MMDDLEEMAARQVLRTADATTHPESLVWAHKVVSDAERARQEAFYRQYERAMKDIASMVWKLNDNDRQRMLTKCYEVEKLPQHERMTAVEALAKEVEQLPARQSQKHWTQR